MERDLRPFVRPVSKDVFLTLLSVCSNVASLNLCTAVMQQERLRGLILYLPAAIIPFYIYNKVYTPRRCTLFAYIGVVAYPYIEAMRQPEHRDKHGEIHYSHVFFVSIIYADCGVLINQTSDISLQTSNVNGQQGRVGQALCVSLSLKKI